MDKKEIALQEIEGKDVTELTKDFTDDDRKEYAKVLIDAAKETKDKTLREVEGLRQAKKALEDKKGELESDQLTEYQKKVRGEQIQIARDEFIREFNPSADQLAKLDDEFKKLDSGEVHTSSLIKGIFKRAWVQVDPDTFIEAKRQKDEGDKAAAAELARQAGGGGGTPGGQPTKTYSDEVYRIVREGKANGIEMTLEEAERGLKFSDWKTS